MLPLAEWSIRRADGPDRAGQHDRSSYRVARQAIGDRHAALISAVVLACAPAFFILSRYALDYTYPVPFILGWLYCLLTGLERPGSARDGFSLRACALASVGTPTSHRW